MKMRPRSSPVLLLVSLLALVFSPSLSFAAHEAEDSVKGTSFAASVRNSLNKPLKLIKGNKDDDWHKWKGIGLTTFEVPTVVQDEFVAKWQDLESKVWDQEKDHVIAYDLKRPKLENRVFYSYMEWDSIENLWAHAEKDYVTEFWEWVQGKSILAEFSPLWAAVDDEREKKEAMTKTGENAERQSNPNMHLTKVDPTKDPAYVSMWFHIKPSMKDHFMIAWKDYATGTWKEDKSKVFALREFGFKNHHLVGYGEWETVNDFFWHMEQPYFQNFQNFIKASDIDMDVKPMFKLGKK